MDLRHIKILRFVMNTIVSWPGRELGEKVWKISDYFIYCLLGQTLFASVACTGYVIENVKEIPFIILGHSCITALLLFTCTTKIIILVLRKSFREIGKIFLTKMHLVYFKNKSEYAMKTHLQVHRLSEWCTIYLVSLLNVTIIISNIAPIYVNYSEGLYSEGIPENSSKVYAHVMYYAFPFECNYLTKFKPYLVASLFTCYVSYLCGTFLSVLDLFLYIIVFHIWGHYKILIHDLKTIPAPMSPGHYTAEESNQVNEKLKECIRYHLLIAEFTKMMSQVFGATLFINIGFILLSSCLLLLECSHMNPEVFMRYGPLTVMVFQELIQFGLVFELIGTAGDDLAKQVYNLPWEYMNSNNRFIVLFFLMNVQTPVRVKALGMTDMGIATVVSIIKTSFSCFTFLRTID